ncbi:MAG: translocation/assembly module TamB domain-containing protein [Planctomycetes bacterium]|nr:translocation/assembly module TamB domain-containing protein [Planctomycetota bacterium]
MKITKKKILLIAASVIVMAIAGAFIFRFALFSGIIKKQAFAVIGNLLHVQVLSGELSGELLGDVTITNVSFKPLEKSFFTEQVNIKLINAKFSIWGLITGRQDWFKEATLEGMNVPVDGNKLEAFYKEMQAKQKPSGPGKKIKPPKIRLDGISVKAVYNDIQVTIDDFDLAFDTHRDFISALANTGKISIQLPQLYEEILNLKTSAEEKSKMVFWMKYMFELDKQSADVDIDLDLSKLEKQNTIQFNTNSNIFGGRINIAGRVLTKAEAGQTAPGESAGLEVQIKFDGITPPEKYLQGHKAGKVAGDIRVSCLDFKLENLKVTGNAKLLEPLVFNGYQVDSLRAEDIEFTPSTMNASATIYAGAYGCDVKCIGRANLNDKSFHAAVTGHVDDMFSLNKFAGGKEVHGIVDFSADAQGSLKSIPDSLTVTSDFTILNAAYLQYKLASVRGGLSMKDKVVSFDNITIIPAKGIDDAIKCAGKLHLNDKTVEAVLSGNIRDLSSFNDLSGGRRLAGSMNFSADASANLDDIFGSLKTQAEFNMENAGLEGYTCKSISGGITVSDGVIHLINLEGNVMAGSNDGFNCAGELHMKEGTIDFTAGAYVADLSTAREMIRKIAGDLPLNGSFEMYATVDGNINAGLDELRISTLFRGKDLALDKYHCESVKGQFEFEKGRVLIDEITFKHNKAECVITGGGLIDGEFTANVSMKSDNIGATAGEMAGINLPLTGGLDASASITRYPEETVLGLFSGEGKIAFSNVIVELQGKKIPIESIKAGAVYKDNKLSLDFESTGPSTVKTALKGTVELKGLLTPGNPGDSVLDMALNVSGITEESAKGFVKLPADTAFGISLDLRLKGTAAEPELQLEYNVEKVSVRIEDEVKEFPAVHGSVTYDKNLLIVNPVRIATPYGVISANGNVPVHLGYSPGNKIVFTADKDINLTIEITEINVELLKEKYLKGTIAFKELTIIPRIYLNVTGTLARASFAGGMDITGGIFILNEKMPAMEDINMQVRFGTEASFEDIQKGLADAFMEAHVKVLLGKEPVFVDGTVKASRGFWHDGRLNPELVFFDFKTNSKRALFASEYLMRMRAGFDLQIAGTPADALIKGNVVVDAFKYEVPLSGSASGPEQKEVKRSKKPIPIVMHFVPPIHGLDWLKYDITVKAPDNLYLMNDFFNGKAGCDLKIGGNAAVPEIAGQAWVNGTIKLPTADFLIEKCVINFPGGAELPPTINMSSNGKIGLVSIKLGVNGTIFDPQPMLSSDPFYSQEDLLSLIAVGVVKPSGSGMIISSSGFTNWMSKRIVKPIPGGKEIAEILEKISFEYEFKAGKNEPIIRAEYPLSTRFSIYCEKDEYSNFNFDLQYIFRLRF